MGLLMSSSSSYKFVTTIENDKPVKGNVNTPDWIATPNNARLPMKADSYENIAPIGKGKFGLVHLAKANLSQKYVAIKYISKQVIFDSEANDRIQNELDILMRISHPFIMQTFGVFDTNTCLAIVCEFCVGGELYHLLKKKIKLKEDESKFYFCELVCVLKFLHEEKNIVYRDLKPENILIDAQGHIKLCDFGFATYMRNSANEKEGEGLRDGCGTAMYIAPEIANGFSKQPHGFPVDWWACGCILFEMITGQAPFGDSDHMSKFEIFNNITENNPSIPVFLNINLRNLIKGLLDKNAQKRYTSKEILENPWMQGISWANVEKKAVKPPWIPTCSKAGTTENFIKWDNVLLPQSNPPAHVTGYCNNIVLPKARIPIVGNNDEQQSVPNGTANGIPPLQRRSSASAQPSNTAMNKQMSSRGSLAAEKSKMKLDRNPSKLDGNNTKNDENANINPNAIRSPVQRPGKQMSSPVLGGASSKKVVPRS